MAYRRTESKQFLHVRQHLMYLVNDKEFHGWGVQKDKYCFGLGFETLRKETRRKRIWNLENFPRLLSALKVFDTSGPRSEKPATNSLCPMTSTGSARSELSARLVTLDKY